MFEVTVAAVKKSKHGAYGRRLATMVVVVAERGHDWQEARERAMAAFTTLLPGVKLTTDIVDVTETK